MVCCLLPVTCPLTSFLLPPWHTRHLCCPLRAPDTLLPGCLHLQVPLRWHTASSSDNSCSPVRFAYHAHLLKFAPCSHSNPNPSSPSFFTFLLAFSHSTYPLIYITYYGLLLIVCCINRYCKDVSSVEWQGIFVLSLTHPKCQDMPDIKKALWYFWMKMFQHDQIQEEALLWDTEVFVVD